METKFTKGEWRRGTTTVGDHNGTIADCRTYRPVEENIANAKLIADCPLMFDFIFKKANEGDKKAKQIIARHA